MSTQQEQILKLLEDGEWWSGTEVRARIPGSGIGPLLSTLVNRGKLQRQKGGGREVLYKLRSKAVAAKPAATPFRPLASAVCVPPARSTTPFRPGIASAELIRARLVAEAKLHGSVISNQVQQQLTNIETQAFIELAKLVQQLPGCDWHLIMTGEPL